jgi:hypothetical protein
MGCGETAKAAAVLARCECLFTIMNNYTAASGLSSGERSGWRHWTGRDPVPSGCLSEAPHAGRRGSLASFRRGLRRDGRGPGRCDPGASTYGSAQASGRFYLWPLPVKGARSPSLRGKRAFRRFVRGLRGDEIKATFRCQIPAWVARPADGHLSSIRAGPQMVAVHATCGRLGVRPVRPLDFGQAACGPPHHASKSGCAVRQMLQASVGLLKMDRQD